MFWTQSLETKHYEQSIFLLLIIFLFIFYGLFIRKWQLLVKDSYGGTAIMATVDSGVLP